ncbi:Hypothetical predicted protein [Lecanosticta acicola]|uniref:Uncharacterized protein n=1 Tax=Lecanosticta acicola TaxID=111012 RepID=A0AAI9EA56_9PEZI|nr:Hypothetical predicted protein [Lecanosticta acicola]
MASNDQTPPHLATNTLRMYYGMDESMGVSIVEAGIAEIEAGGEQAGPVEERLLRNCKKVREGARAYLEELKEQEEEEEEEEEQEEDFEMVNEDQAIQEGTPSGTRREQRFTTEAEMEAAQRQPRRAAE